MTTLLMGWMNSVPIFHDDVMFILQDEIPAHTIVFVDDVPIKGPAHAHLLADGTPATLSANPRVRQFIWEHLQVVMRIVQRIKY